MHPSTVCAPSATSFSSPHEEASQGQTCSRRYALATAPEPLSTGHSSVELSVRRIGVAGVGEGGQPKAAPTWPVSQHAETKEGVRVGSRRGMVGSRGLAHISRAQKLARRAPTHSATWPAARSRILRQLLPLFGWRVTARRPTAPGLAPRAALAVCTAAARACRPQ
eukprot:CAMPEP_0181203188 /NCGR_PEP_ID=MMETSP1096-20121128/19249_1 /TAXON_ID=156174 ORGANISM="Chrysochromulina ericina, Strain CCMP281" /NCGR_SAMPLE_ID=MMETSP1096 /ASSEMBLY_ACC=CAM_ASM_000453 /LENGTH=165 /DNA_ID=CAMNT_0023293765 /DNA_START=313 /DNA_END=811 /DNA_ORIENTATION=-